LILRYLHPTTDVSYRNPTVSRLELPRRGKLVFANSNGNKYTHSWDECVEIAEEAKMQDAHPRKIRATSQLGTSRTAFTSPPRFSEPDLRLDRDSGWPMREAVQPFKERHRQFFKLVG
jgi:hypothetical protein